MKSKAIAVLAVLTCAIAVPAFSQRAQVPANGESSTKGVPEFPGAKAAEIHFVVNTVQGGFGFDIVNGKKLMIHQPTIPAISGNKPFFKREDAVKVAKLMIDKINNNIMPPSISLEELHKLHVKTD